MKKLLIIILFLALIGGGFGAYYFCRGKQMKEILKKLKRGGM